MAEKERTDLSKVMNELLKGRLDEGRDNKLGVAYVIMDDKGFTASIGGMISVPSLISGIKHLMNYAISQAKERDPEGLAKFMMSEMGDILDTLSKAKATPSGAPLQRPWMKGVRK